VVHLFLLAQQRSRRQPKKLTSFAALRRDRNSDQKKVNKMFVIDFIPDDASNIRTRSFV
jgi:hypothetical protein